MMQLAGLRPARKGPGGAVAAACARPAAAEAAAQLPGLCCCWDSEAAEAVEGVVQRQLDVFEGLSCCLADFGDLLVQSCGGDAAGDPAGAGREDTSARHSMAWHDACGGAQDGMTHCAGW